MKVLQVIDKLNIGGAEKVFIMLSTLLLDAKVNVDALLFDRTGELTKQLDKRLQVHNLNRRNKYAISSLKGLHSICTAYDIVHVHMRHCFSYVALAKFIFRGKYKIALHDHYGDIDINTVVPTGLKLFNPDAYIGVSHSLQQWALERLKINSRQVHVLRNTILPVEYNVVPGTIPNACMIANFRKTKNIEFAVSLFKKLQWPLTIYGHKNDIDYYNSILLQMDDAANIKLVTGISGFNEIGKEHNLAIHTAVSESGPLVLLEYMSVGIPFLAYKTGEVAATVEKELPDMFMDNFDEEQWIARLQKIVAGNGYDTQLKSTFSKYFSTDKYTSDCLQIYKSIVC